MKLKSRQKYRLQNQLSLSLNHTFLTLLTNLIYVGAFFMGFWVAMNVLKYEQNTPKGII
jgi:hypothetical protein